MLLFSGADLPTEYRSYPASRLFQYVIWIIFGAKSYIYPLIIATFKIASAWLLLSICRTRKLPESTSLAVALVWLLSPFSATWTFHHFTYLVLPFELLILTYFYIIHESNSLTQRVAVCFLGSACALTGEMQFAIASTTFLLGAASIIPAKRTKSILAAVSLLSSLIIHRLIWSYFSSQANSPQRFEIHAINDFNAFFDRGTKVLLSIPTSALRQINVIIEGSNFISAILSIFIGLTFFIVITYHRQTKYSEQTTFNVLSKNPGLAREDKRFVFLSFFLAITSSVVYIALAVLTGQVLDAMPRRYGMIPLTVLSLFFILSLGSLSALLNVKSGELYGKSVGVTIIAFLSVQFYFFSIPSARSFDDAVKKEIVAAINSRSENSSKGVLFFVSSDKSYYSEPANSATIGPKTEKVIRREMFESPLSHYWTAQPYAVNVLGFRYAAMPSGNFSPSDGRVFVSGNPYPKDPGNILASDAIVVANLGFENEDYNVRNIRVFSDYESFDPYFFGRRIVRDIFLPNKTGGEEFSIDLGATDELMSKGTFNVVNLDKKYSSPFVFNKDWVSNYGFQSGEDAIFSNAEVGGDLSYWKTNRHGAFQYAVAFRELSNIEISLDFWEQWGRKPGERIFDIDVSWNGRTWANLGHIDPARINGARPFSIVLSRTFASMFVLRIRPVPGTMDIPFIQGMRIRKL